MNAAQRLLAASLCFAASSSAEDLVHVGEIGADAVLRVAQAKGFLKQERIRIEAAQVGASADLMRKLHEGSFDVVHTNADNVVAWAEGQGVDRQPHDFMIFIGGSWGLRLELIVPPEIKSFDDLKGKALAVDAYNTGYSPVLVYMLKKNGLILGQHYAFKAVGAGGARILALKRGEVAAAFVRLDDDLRGKAFHVLARTQDYVSAYARGVGAARRAWASRNAGVLVRYIRALVRSVDWLRDPDNQAEAIQVIGAERSYRELLDSRFGLIPRGAINREGVKVVLQLREAMGEMKPPLPSPDKYIDERYYRRAVASSGSEVRERKP